MEGWVLRIGFTFSNTDMEWEGWWMVDDTRGCGVIKIYTLAGVQGGMDGCVVAR